MREYRTIKDLKNVMDDRSKKLNKRIARIYKISFDDNLFCTFWNSQKEVFEYI